MILIEIDDDLLELRKRFLFLSKNDVSKEFEDVKNLLIEKGDEIFLKIHETFNGIMEKSSLKVNVNLKSRNEEINSLKKFALEFLNEEDQTNQVGSGITSSEFSKEIISNHVKIIKENSNEKEREREVSEKMISQLSSIKDTLMKSFSFEKMMRKDDLRRETERRRELRNNFFEFEKMKSLAVSPIQSLKSSFFSGGMMESALTALGMKSLVGGSGLKLLKTGGILTAIFQPLMDAISGLDFSEVWQVSKLSSFLGSLIGGTSKGLEGAFSKAGQLAFSGAVIGTTIAPGIGTIAGGLIGGVLGAIAGYIGGENFAKFFDFVADGIQKAYKFVVENIPVVGPILKFGVDSFKSVSELFLGKEKKTIFSSNKENQDLKFPKIENENVSLSKVERNVSEKERIESQNMMAQITSINNVDNRTTSVSNVSILRELEPFNVESSYRLGIGGTRQTTFAF